MVLETHMFLLHIYINLYVYYVSHFFSECFGVTIVDPHGA
jgi:hypothetical protein